MSPQRHPPGLQDSEEPWAKWREPHGRVRSPARRWGSIQPLCPAGSCPCAPPHPLSLLGPAHAHTHAQPRPHPLVPASAHTNWLGTMRSHRPHLCSLCAQRGGRRRGEGPWSTPAERGRSCRIKPCPPTSLTLGGQLLLLVPSLPLPCPASWP